MRTDVWAHVEGYTEKGPHPVTISRRTLIALAPTLLVVGPLAAAPAAHAALTTCRSDPIVVLSTGVTLQISEDIAAGPSQVAAIAYVVHAPAGTTLLSVTYTDGAIGAKEKLKLSTDAPSHTYTTDADVSTSVRGVAITATTLASRTADPTAQTATGSVSGQDDQHLLVTLSY
jgi:hypothetical protein